MRLHFRNLLSSWLAPLLAGVFVLGCDAPPDSPACDEELCFAPSPARCDGDTRVTFGFGTCEAGNCVRPENRETCASGCSDGACLDDPCSSLDCENPDPTCDGVFAVRYPGEPSCEAGACRAAEPSRTDCSARGQVCANGRCVADVACDGLACDPPPGSCDEAVATRYENGRCEEGECVWDALVETCEGALSRCEDGVCVADDACDGVVCDVPPAPTCEGDDRVVHVAPGTCDDRTGTCVWQEERTSCTDSGQRCVDGTCATVTVCDDIPCITPPEDRCEGAIALIHDLAAACVDGGCEYTPRRVECSALGQVCVDGACVDGDPCADVSCDTPPEPFCDGDEHVTSTGGSCARGRCSYAETRTPCAATGLTCEPDVGCVDRCAERTCDAPPEPFCDGGRAVVSTLPGTCRFGACSYVTRAEDCVAGGGSCEAGVCTYTDPCEGVVCDAPPEARCDLGVAIRYELEGAGCFGGECRYTAVRDDCIEAGQFCLDGSCVDEDPCPLLACDTPPPPSCDGDTLLRWSTPSFCSAGLCIYNLSPVDCSAGGGTCADGACVEADLCEVYECRFPPAPTCDGTRAIRFGTPDDCSTGVCDYPRTEVDCSTPADARCVGDLLVESGAGRCEFGTCEFDTTLTDCAEAGLTCLAGACRAPVGCEGVVCDTPPAPRCSSGRVLAPTGTGRCADGVCGWDEYEVADCVALGQRCEDGACVTPDPCETVSCDACPAPTCEGTRVVEATCPGTCGGGTCSFARVTARDCADDGLACRDGVCVDDDPCAGVTCTTPPEPLCDGDALLRFAPPVACDGGECAWTLEIERCDSRVGGFCEAGACGFDDPCVGVDCTPAEAPGCNSGTVRRVPIGVCADGFCDVTYELEPCPAGRFCESGVCISAAECTAGCDAPDEAYCAGADLQTALSFSLPGACSDLGVCVYAETAVDCRASDRICVDGACVDPSVPGPGDLVVNEVSLEPGGSAARRWFEIYNRSDRSHVLGGLRVTASSSTTFVVPSSPDRVIPPGEHYVLAATSLPELSGYPVVLWSAGFGLDPTSDTLSIQTDAGTTIDQVSWDATWPIAAGASLSLDPRLRGPTNDDPARWCPATPSPGLGNPECADVSAPAPLPGELLLAELLVDAGSTGLRFVEIWSVAPTARDLTGVRVEGPNGLSVELTDAALLFPGATWVVASADSTGVDQVASVLASSTRGIWRLVHDDGEIAGVDLDVVGAGGPDRSAVFCGASEDEQARAEAWTTAWIPFASDAFGSPGAALAECTDSLAECVDDEDCVEGLSYCLGAAAVDLGPPSCNAEGRCDYSVDRTATYCPTTGAVCDDGACVSD